MQESFQGILLHFVYSKRFSAESCPNFLKLIHRMIQFHYLGFIEGTIDDLGESHIFLFQAYVFQRIDSHCEDPALVHLPTFADMNSVADFLSMCSIGILSNVLDPRTYMLPDHVKSLPNYRAKQRHEWHSGGRTFGLHLYSGSIVLSHQLVLPSLRVDIGGTRNSNNTSPTRIYLQSHSPRFGKRCSRHLKRYKPSIPISLMKVYRTSL